MTSVAYPILSVVLDVLRFPQNFIRKSRVTLTPWTRIVPDKLCPSASQFPDFQKVVGSLLRSQEPATAIDPDSD
jgi:hypothetical protein